MSNDWTTFADRYAVQLASIERAVAVAGGLSRVQKAAERYLAQQVELQRVFERAGGAAYIQSMADKYVAQHEELQKAFERAGGAAEIRNMVDKYVAQQEELLKVFKRAGGAPYIRAATDTYARYAAALDIPHSVVGSLESIMASGVSLAPRINDLQRLALTNEVQRIARTMLQSISGAEQGSIESLVGSNVDELEQQVEDFPDVEHPVRIAVWMALAPLLLILWTHPAYGDWIRDNLPLVIAIVAFTKWAWQNEP